MGQKINPTGFRLPVTRNWTSRWYAVGRNFSRTLGEDLRVRAFLEKKLKAASVSRILIERPANNARITIFSARPGVVIGKQGADIEVLKAEVQKMVGVPVHINIEEVRRPELDAQLIADGITQQLEKRVMFRRAMKRSMQNAMRLGAKGIKIIGAEIVRTEWYREGRVPLQTLRANIDYGFSEANTTYGVIGVKVWVYKGDNLGREDAGEAAPAPADREDRRRRPSRRPRKEGEGEAKAGARRSRKAITMEDIEEASMKVMAGPEKKSRGVTPEEKKLTAYHEAGHAVAGFYCKHHPRVHEITIIPRGQAGGYTMYLPEKDRSYVTKGEMFEDIVSSLGGRVAEQLILEDISTGASNDLQQATNIARQMITKYGFSERLGPVVYGTSQEETFLGRDFGQGKGYSETTAAEIDSETRDIIDEAYETCRRTLTEHIDQLHALAQALMEREKLYEKEANAAMAGETLTPREDPDAKPAEDQPAVQPVEQAETAEAAEPAEPAEAVDAAPQEAPAPETPDEGEANQ